MYIVLENDRPAEYPFIPAWANSRFSKFEEAITYSKQWLGEWETVLPRDWRGSKYDYSGHGDTIAIYNTMTGKYGR